LDWSLPDGFAVGEPRWPLPRRYSEGQTTVYGLEGEVTLLIPVDVSPDVLPGTRTLSADIEWLTCEDVCIPSFATLTVSVSVGKPSSAGAAAEPSMRVPEPPREITAFAESTVDDLVIRVPGSVFASWSSGELWFYPFEWGHVDHSAPQDWRRTGDEIVGSLRTGPSPGDRIRGLLVAHSNGEPTAGYTVDASVNESILRKE
jgi:thiol:disulfide interchange protein DsbD